MEIGDLLLGVMVLAIGMLMAWNSGPFSRVVLFASALLVSGLLFMPGEQIAGLAGKDGIRAMRELAARTPWDISNWTHFLIFVWLGLLVWLARADLRGWKAWSLVAVLAVSAEVAQSLAPGREPRLDDVLLNLAGGMAGILLGIAVRLATRSREGLEQR